MAAVKIRRTRVAINTSTGTQDITISGFGTPKAAIFVLSGGVTAGTVRDGAKISIGFTDGTNSYAVGVAAQDAVTTSNAATSLSANCVSHSDYAGSAATDVAAFSAWITDGLRINWTTVSGTAYLLEVILIAGDDIDSVAVGMHDLGTGTASQTISLGWQADLVFALMGRGNVSSLHTSAQISLGAYERTGNAQGMVSWAASDAQAGARLGAHVSNTYSAGFFTTGGSTLYNVTLGSHASGFTATASASASANDLFYLAIKWADTVGAAVFIETTPTTASPTSYSKTGLSFEPGFGITLTGASTTTALNVTDTDGFGFSSFDADTIGGVLLTDNDEATTTNARSVAGSWLADGDGSVSPARASSSTLTSFNSDGWTKSQSTNWNSLAYKHFSIAIESNPKTVSLSVNETPQVQTLDSPFLGQHSVLAPASLTQLQTESQPSYFIEHNVLAPAGLAQVQTLSLPSLVQHNLLSPAGLAQIQTLDLPALLQHSVLSPDALAQLQTLDLPELLQHSLLSPEGLAQLQALSEAALTAFLPVYVDGMTQLQTLSQPSMTLYNALPPDGLTQAQTVSEATMLVYGGVSAYDLVQAQLINEPELLQQNILVVQQLAQAQPFGAVAMVEHNLLAPASLVQLQTLDGPALISHAILAVNALAQLQTLSATSLLQHSVMAPAGLAHLITLSEPTLLQIRKVSPLELVHVQTFDQPILIQPILGAALAHLQEMSTTTLLQHNVLMADVLQQAQQLMEPILRPFFTVTPHGMSQGQTLSHVYIRYVINTMLEGVLRAYAELDGTLMSEAALEAQLSATASLFGALKSLPVQ